METQTNEFNFDGCTENSGDKYHREIKNIECPGQN